MQRVGAFRKAEDHLQACGVPREVAQASTNHLQEAYKKGMEDCLGREFAEEYPHAHSGVLEGLKCVSSCGFHPEVPGLTLSFIESMKKQKILEAETQDGSAQKESAKGSEGRAAIANRLDHMDPQHQNGLLGFIAVVSAYFNPEFSKCVLSRCHSGFLSALDHTDYRHDFEESMRKELFDEFIEDEALQSRKGFLEAKLQELKEAERDCEGALKKLRQLVNCK